MSTPTRKSNGDERKIPKGRGNETTSTTDKPISMIGHSNYKEENKRPERGGKNHGSIKPHGTVSRIMHEQYIRTIKTKEGNPKYKG